MIANPLVGGLLLPATSGVPIQPGAKQALSLERERVYFTK